LSRQTVLVTGASGFVGSHLVEALLACGDRVRALDVRVPGQDVIATGNLAGAGAATFVAADLVHDPLDEAVAGCDVVYHLAGTPGVRDCWGPKFDRYIAGNITATNRVLTACEHAGVKRLVVASSSSVYGQVAGASKETDATRPLSPYGVSKLAAEQLALAHARRPGSTLSTVALRLFTVYGPRQRGDMAIGRLLLAASNGLTMPLHGDGSQRREFSYVGDAVDAFVAAGAVAAQAEVVNVGGGTSIPMREVLGLTEKLTGRPLLLDRSDLKPGEVQDTVADLTQAKALLGYEPNISLEEGMARHLAWLQGVDDSYRDDLLAQLKS
jgi:nucleoside-diphosphate-sugar epimerase